MSIVRRDLRRASSSESVDGRGAQFGSLFGLIEERGSGLALHSRQILVDLSGFERRGGMQTRPNRPARRVLSESRLFKVLGIESSPNMHPHLLKVHMERRGGRREGEGIWVMQIEIVSGEERVSTEQGDIPTHAVALLEANIQKTVQERDAVTRGRSERQGREGDSSGSRRW
jgi:hypothetical protein